MKICGPYANCTRNSSMPWMRDPISLTAPRKVSMHEDPPNCQCGHSWDNHHHGCIVNPAYCEYTDSHMYGTCGGLAAQECEWTELNGERIRENEPECLCGSYVNSISGLSMSDLVDRIEAEKIEKRV